MQTAEHNLSLGLKRAQIIKNLLIARGIKTIPD
jgi:outer membrane protein OmpA-like peptidoglycan-associated protein